MGITRSTLAVLGTLALAGCVTKSSGGGGEPDASFDVQVSFDSPSGDDSSIADSTTTDSPTADTSLDSGTQDTGMAMDSSTAVDSGTDSGVAAEAGTDADVEGGCGPTSCSQATDPDSGAMYSTTCNATCNGFSVNCTCAADSPQNCFCSVGNSAPSCLTGSLSSCGDQALCSADLSSDSANCGRCGHACPAGITCTNGMCPAQALSFGVPDGGTEPYPDDWVSDGTFIYASSCYEHLVFKVPVGGEPASGAPTVISSGQNCPLGIGIDSTNAYWLDDTTGTVWTAPLSGAGTPTLLGTYGQQWFSGPIASHGVAMDASTLYFAVQPSSGYGFVFSLPKTGGTPQVLANDTTVIRSTVYVDASNVYYMTLGDADAGGGAQIRTVPKNTVVDGGAPSTIVATFYGDQPVSFVLQGGSFYVGAGISNTIWTFPVTGGALTPFFDTALYGAPRRLAINATSLFWTDFISGWIYEQDLAGGLPQRVATFSSGEPDLILLDGTSVYWTSNLGTGYWALPVSYRP